MNTETLEKLFAIIIDEARRRPEFARRLQTALPKIQEADCQRTPAPKPGATTTPLSPKAPGKTKCRTGRGRFDPHAFSLIAVMKREGEAALRAHLAGVRLRSQLLKMAEAQHIPVERSLFTRKGVPLSKAREALIAGVKQRIQDRLAAAS